MAVAWMIPSLNSVGVWRGVNAMYKAIAATAIFQTLRNAFGVKAQQLLFHILSPKAWRTILSGGVPGMGKINRNEDFKVGGSHKESQPPGKVYLKYLLSFILNKFCHVVKLLPDVKRSYTSLTFSFEKIGGRVV